MDLDTSLFPPDIEYRLNEQYGDVKYMRKQVQIFIGVEKFAVVNSDYFDGVWREPSFVILRATMPSHEVQALPDIIPVVQKILMAICKSTKDEMEKLLK